MRRNFTKSLLMGGLALAGLTGAGQLAQAQTDKATAPTEQYKATVDKKKTDKRKININPVSGGLDFPNFALKTPGLSPKEYGMRFGNGGSKRSNRNRYAHNAKVKRRNAA